MSEKEGKLLEGLRALAASQPREAPAHLEQRLLVAFRKRSAARRRKFWIAAGTGAIAAAIALMFWMRPAPSTPAPSVPAQSRVAQAIPEPPQSSVQAAVQPRPAPPTHARIRRSSRHGAEVAVSFYRLPNADMLPPLESATVVRVQLPLSSFRLMGVPISEERAGEPIQADVLLGQDGMARGVRFVQ